MMKFHVEDPHDSMNECMCYGDNFGNYAILNLSADMPIDSYAIDDQDGMWEMYFDGAKSRTCVGVGIVFTSPTCKIMPFSSRLEFDWTNKGA
jgi:hypothetical protein